MQFGIHSASLICKVFVVVVQSLSRIHLFSTPWTAARQASLSFIISQSLLRLMSIELVIPSSHLIFHCPLLLLPSIFSRTRIFSNESALYIRCPQYWSFSFSFSPSNIKSIKFMKCFSFFANSSLVNMVNIFEIHWTFCVATPVSQNDAVQEGQRSSVYLGKAALEQESEWLW